jgi:PQQ-like domain
MPSSAETGIKQVISRELVLMSVRTAAVDRSFPDPNGPVYAAATDGQGGWFVAGQFTDIGSQKVAGIAHLHANGLLDTRWQGRLARSPAGGGRPRYWATTMVRVGMSLYVAGPFWVEALDARTGARRWLVRDPDPNGWPGLAANAHRVYFAGSFTHLEGAAHRFLVALDPRTGAVLPWSLPPFNGYGIGALALDHNRLFIGGDRMRVDGKAATGIVAIDARSGRLTAWKAPQIYDADTTIFITHGIVFTAAQRDEWAAASERSGRPVTNFGQGGFTSFSTFAALGDTLYVWGGDCNPPEPWSIQGERRESIAAIDLRTNRVAPWAPDIGSKYVCLSALAADRQQVLAAGSFTQHID